MRVDIWSDVVCPWCYVGKARFEKALAGFEHRDEVEVVYRSFELDPSPDAGGFASTFDMLSKKYGMSPDQARQAEDRVASLARAEGLDFDPARPVGNTFDLHRVIHLAKEKGVQHEVLTTINNAYFGEAAQVFDPAVVTGITARAGLDASAIGNVLENSELYADEVRRDEKEARELGISGVPFFVFDMALGVSGAQATDTFSSALDQAWVQAEHAK
jgi:predicted DsbA family dithiol-disulfide isomerase